MNVSQRQWTPVWGVNRLDMSQGLALARKLERLSPDGVWQLRAVFTLDLHPLEVTELVMRASTEEARQIIQELIDKERWLPGKAMPINANDFKARYAVLNAEIARSRACGIDSSKTGTDKTGASKPDGEQSASRDCWGRPHSISHVAVRMLPGTFDAMFMCPITQDMMREPVVAADGYSYEKSAIEKWLLTHDKSPMTNLPLPHKNLVPNHALRWGIQDYRFANCLP